jgi:glycosyltransferase involved in cell wall biosynthesis
MLVRILYCSDNSSDHNLRFLQKISSAGHDVVFCDLVNGNVRDGWLPRDVRSVQHQVAIGARASFSLEREYLSQFRSVLGEVRPDIVHAGPLHTCGYIAALAKFHPLIVMSWGSDLLLHAPRDPACRSATKIALDGAEGFVCDSDAVLVAAREYATLPDWRVAQFPWGISSGMFSPTGPLPSPAVMPFGSETIPLICTRSWEPVYRIDLLLRAFLRAYQQEARLRLLLVGSGSESERITEFIGQNELKGVVLTPGKLERAELPAWFRASCGYVSCAESDGTSVSMLEAMATGLPVLVTDIPSNREWVKPDENGWLALDAADFADKLVRLASLTRAQRDAISTRNRQVVASRADWDRNSNRLLELYGRMIGQKSAVPA